MPLAAIRCFAFFSTLSISVCAESATGAPVSPDLKGYAGVYSVSERVFDGTNQTSADDLRRVIPDIFTDPPRLNLHDSQPAVFTIAFVKGAIEQIETPEEAGTGGIISAAYRMAVADPQPTPSSYQPIDDYQNALISYNDSILMRGMMTHVRFVEIPSEEASYTERPYSYGFSNLRSLGANYNVTGLFCGSEGNLQLSASPGSSSIGSASYALRTSFAATSRMGQPVDFFIEVNATSDLIDIYVAVGGRSFGHAFRIPPSKTHGEDSEGSNEVLSLLPAIRFTREQTMAAAVILWHPQPIPSQAAYRTKQASNGPGLTGDWILPEDANNKPILTLSVVDGTSQLASLTHEVQIIVRVANIFKARYKVGLLGQVLSRSAILSTKVGVPSHLAEVERNIVQLLECADHIVANRHKQLLIKCAGTATHQVFDSYVDQADRAVTINPWS